MIYVKDRERYLQARAQPHENVQQDHRVEAAAQAHDDALARLHY